MNALSSIGSEKTEVPALCRYQNHSSLRGEDWPHLFASDLVVIPPAFLMVLAVSASLIYGMMKGEPVASGILVIGALIGSVSFAFYLLLSLHAFGKNEDGKLQNRKVL